MSKHTISAAANGLPITRTTVVFDEWRWIEAFEGAGYEVKAHRGTIILDLVNSPTDIHNQLGSQILAWQKATPNWKRLVIAALSTRERSAGGPANG